MILGHVELNLSATSVLRLVSTSNISPHQCYQSNVGYIDRYNESTESIDDRDSTSVGSDKCLNFGATRESNIPVALVDPRTRTANYDRSFSLRHKSDTEAAFL